MKRNFYKFLALALTFIFMISLIPAEAVQAVTFGKVSYVCRVEMPTGGINTTNSPSMASGYYNRGATASIVIGGWAITMNGVKSIYYTINGGATKYSVTYGRRTDVLDVYTAYKSANDVSKIGYTAAVPTSRLNDGNNTVKVIAVDNYGNLYDVGKITLTISGGMSQSVSYMCNMEKPVTASAIGQNTPQKLSVTVAQTDKYFELSGWAITSNGISKVVYKINNGVEKSTSSNKRSDVVSNTGIPSYKYQCDVNKIGYKANVYLSELNVGSNVIDVYAYDKNSKSRLICHLTVNVEKTNAKVNYDSLDKYLYSIGKNVNSATATDVKNYFKNKSNDKDYLTYLNKCKVDASYAPNYKNDYEKKKEFYDFIAKYAKKLDSKCDTKIGLVLDTLYIRTCFNQLAYGNSNDDVIEGVTGAFDRIASYTGPVFEQIIKGHTLVMKAEYKLIKERINQIQTVENALKDYSIFDAEMAAEIYLFALSLLDRNEFALGEVTHKIHDSKVKEKYLRAINNNRMDNGMKYVNKKITKEYAEKLFLFNLVFLDDPDGAWQYFK